MPRQFRIEYEGAIYHLLSGGDRREDIFWDERDRRSFLGLLEQTCARTGWEVHAYCLVNNHFHLIVEGPPEPGCGNEMVAGNLHHTL